MTTSEDNQVRLDDELPEATRPASRHTITALPVDRKAGMTLGEVAAWVLDATQQAGISADAQVVADTGYRGQLRKLEVAG